MDKTPDFDDFISELTALQKEIVELLRQQQKTIASLSEKIDDLERELVDIKRHFLDEDD